MSESDPAKIPLSYYMRAHAKYILPTWLFPAFFIGFGEMCQWLIPKNDNLTGILFFVLVAPVFFGTFFWSHKVRKEIPYGKYVFLTMMIPFLITIGITVVLIAFQFLFKAFFP